MANEEVDLQKDLATTTHEVSDFEKLLGTSMGVRADRSDGKAERIRGAVRTLAEQALADTALISGDAIASIQAIIAEIDKKLTTQVNKIIHHEAFQKLESTWRGLFHLINNTETDQTLKVRVLNVSKADLGKTLKRYKGVAWDQSPLFKRIYEAEYGQLGGEPYGCLVGDFYFDHGPQDVDMLNSLAQIAAAAHAPFIAASAPSVLGMQSWQELGNPRDLAKIFSTPDYAAWQSLRKSEDSRYLCLTMPRFLARLPYGAKTDPVDEFDFEEDVEGADHSKFTWANSAFAMAVNINRAFKEFGWCTRIRGVESGGAVEGLPVHTFPTDDGGVDMKCPTEIAISDRREKELSDSGFLPLIHRKNTDIAAFIGAQTLQLPAVYDSKDATANANLSARLPYIFATCRFAHYLKCIVRDKIGSFKERDDVQRWLHDWVMNYVDGDPAHSSEDIKAKRPLAGAEVVVDEDEENPGYYSAKFFLRPHYQLEGMTVSLRLVSRLPSARQGG